MSSLGLPLPPELIFPFVSWGTAVKATEGANISLLFMRTSKHTDRQTRGCTNTTQKVSSRPLLDTHEPCCLRILLRHRFNSLVCSAAHSCCLCVHLCQLVCLVRPACVWMFLFRWHVCFGESLCLLYTVRDDTLGNVIVLFLAVFLNRLTAVTSPVLLRS